MDRSGFFIVKKFHALYTSFGYRTPSGTQIYSLPQEGVEPDAIPKKYRGLDREPLVEMPLKMIASIIRRNPTAVPIHERAAALAMASLGTKYGLLQSLDDVCKVYLILGEPEEWEIIWVRLSEAKTQPPPISTSLGFEPALFPEDSFSAICDCMFFPRWHGTDEEGSLFADFHARVNNHGLFDTPSDSVEFLSFYSSFDWTETGEYSIIEVFTLSNSFYEQLRKPIRYTVISESSQKEGLPAELAGITREIKLERLAHDHKISGIKVLRDITDMGLAEAKAVVESLPKTIVVNHLGDLKTLRKNLVEGGFDFHIRTYK